MHDGTPQPPAKQKNKWAWTGLGLGFTEFVLGIWRCWRELMAPLWISEGFRGVLIPVHLLTNKQTLQAVRPVQQPVAYSQWVLLGLGCGPYHVSSHVPEKYFPTGPRSQEGNRGWRRFLTRFFSNTPIAQGPAHDCRMYCFRFISCLPLQEMITILVLTMPVCTKTMWILLSLPYPGLSASPSLPMTLH